MFENYYTKMASNFMNEMYDENTKEYNRELLTFVLISIFIIYFIFSLISKFFKLPFILIFGAIMGWYGYNLMKR